MRMLTLMLMKYQQLSKTTVLTKTKTASNILFLTSALFCAG
jgi:hypothetical protein